jgi:DNA-directed RNA polymerase specialized sigma24 family protein
MVTASDGKTVSQALNERTVVKKMRGRKPSLTEEKEDQLLRRYLSTPQSLREISSEMGIPHSTARRAIERARARAQDVLLLSFMGGAK